MANWWEIISEGALVKWDEAPSEDPTGVILLDDGDQRLVVWIYSSRSDPKPFFETEWVDHYLDLVPASDPVDHVYPSVDWSTKPYDDDTVCRILDLIRAEAGEKPPSGNWNAFVAWNALNGIAEKIAMLPTEER